MRSNLMRNDRIGVGRSGTVIGDRDQSAPSWVALTDEAFTAPAENSRPALTHLHPLASGVRLGVRDWCCGGGCQKLGGSSPGAEPAKITSPP